VFHVCKGPRTNPVRVMGPFESRDKAQTALETLGGELGPVWWIGVSRARTA
jgi:hypothetical protein